MEEKLVELLKKHHLTISFGESCTGGLLASSIVNVSGASNVFNESYVTYSEEAKMRILGVKKQTLDEYSVYSKEVAKEMAMGVYNNSHANITVGITGRAGGDEFDVLNGTCDVAIYININNISKMILEHYVTKGTRNEVRKNQVNYVFKRIIELLNEIF